MIRNDDEFKTIEKQQNHFMIDDECQLYLPSIDSA